MRYETEVGYYYLAFQSNGHLKRNKMLERTENFTSSLETVDVSKWMCKLMDFLILNHRYVKTLQKQRVKDYLTSNTT